MQSNIEELIKIVQKFCEDRDWTQYHNPKDLAIGLSTESNELLDLFRFKTDEQMKIMMQDNKKRECISDELADILFFLIRFSQLYNFDMVGGLLDKVEKSKKKYPVKTAKGRNLKYTEY